MPLLVVTAAGLILELSNIHRQDAQTISNFWLSYK